MAGGNRIEPVLTGINQTLSRQRHTMKFFRFAALLGFSLLLPILHSGCLIAAKKVLLLEVRPDGSGSGRVYYTDISSLQEDEHDRTLEDYSRLVDGWLNGSEFEETYRGTLNTKKRLFELGGALHGEALFEFEHYNDVGLYRHDEKGPWMYYAMRHTSNVEGFDTSNGSFGGDLMPVIFWPEETDTFRIVNSFDPGEAKVTSLLSLYRRIGVAGSIPERSTEDGE